ncbi:MAG: MGMT family protein [Verrucomicrobia bacterium]|jgi:methylated-DNA-[protein]-cysteine S-methyltransferase|nr:MGMT family protein [Verrucomicrobiota bacterium]
MGDTEFQKRVYEALMLVPRGYVTTYKALAAAVGCGSPRAVGQALKRNPYAPEVPCHRVIASDLSIGGFQGASAGARISKKQAMLEAEGVHFVDGRLSTPDQCFRFSDASR